MNIRGRLTKLEEQAHGAGVQPLSKAEHDAKYRAYIEAIRPVALAVQSPTELEAYLKTLNEIDDSRIVSLEDRRRADGMRARAARMIFEEVRRTA